MLWLFLFRNASFLSSFFLFRLLAFLEFFSFLSPDGFLGDWGSRLLACLVFFWVRDQLESLTRCCLHWLSKEDGKWGNRRMAESMRNEVQRWWELGRWWFCDWKFVMKSNAWVPRNYFECGGNWKIFFKISSKYFFNLLRMWEPAIWRTFSDDVTN